MALMKSVALGGPSSVPNCRTTRVPFWGTGTLLPSSPTILRGLGKQDLCEFRRN